MPDKKYKSGDNTRLAVIILLLILAFGLGLGLGAMKGYYRYESDSKDKKSYKMEKRNMEESKILEEDQVEENSTPIPEINNDAPMVNTIEDNQN